jgi:hypothetical protein
MDVIAANPCGGGQDFENDSLFPETEPPEYEAVCCPLRRRRRRSAQVRTQKIIA